MSLIKKKKKAKKPFVAKGRGASATQASNLRPRQVEKIPPCVKACPSGTDIRGWISIIAQHEKNGLTKDEAYAKAFHTLVETNPFPAVMGRVCPHPCEDDCNREAKDGSVAINAVERYIGDWAIEHDLNLQVLDDEAKPESIGVIGAGPAGLSFAYQLARRGYKVTVYEQTDVPGGMLYWGIPRYRQPAESLQAEIDRIVDLGVELKLNTQVGEDISVAELKEAHEVIFMGMGAWKGRKMRIPGEEGPGFYTGTGYLYEEYCGKEPFIGDNVVIVGGGDTAIDAARIAVRRGANVTILYRRTRVEMPAIDSEVEDAIKEGVNIEFLRLPIEVHRDDGDKLQKITVQKMELGEPDSSGRRRPVPIEGSEYELPIDAVIAAISQEGDWSGLEELKPDTRWLEPDKFGKIDDKLYAGGDVVDLGLATIAVGQGRMAALAIDAELRGHDKPGEEQRPDIPKDRMKFDVYDPAEPAERPHRPVEEWLDKPFAEIQGGLTDEQFMAEMKRCLSCGLCFNCERCWMFCTPSSIKKIDGDTYPGHYYTIDLSTCDGCKKCADECPCGFIDMV